MHFSRNVTFLFKKEVKPKIGFTQHLILCCFKGTQMFLRRMKKMQRGSSLIGFTWNKYQEQLWGRRVLSYVCLSSIYETRLAMAGKSTHLLIHSSIHSHITGHLPCRRCWAGYCMNKNNSEQDQAGSPLLRLAGH